MMVKTVCIHCGITFECDKHELERGQHKYCGVDCYRDAVYQKPIPCPICGAPFLRWVHTNGTKYKVKYCSVECSRIAHGRTVRENQSGENNPFFGKKHSLKTRKHL
ncbi:MAG: NUMOD3 domain-containing DNA-binding protein, partial [Clostridia bacterium]